MKKQSRRRYSRRLTRKKRSSLKKGGGLHSEFKNMVSLFDFISGPSTNDVKKDVDAGMQVNDILKKYFWAAVENNRWATILKLISLMKTDEYGDLVVPDFLVDEESLSIYENSLTDTRDLLYDNKFSHPFLRIAFEKNLHKKQGKKRRREGDERARDLEQKKRDFEILGIDIAVTDPAVIKKAYYKKSMQFHPDKCKFTDQELYEHQILLNHNERISDAIYNIPNEVRDPSFDDFKSTVLQDVLKRKQFENKYCKERFQELSNSYQRILDQII